jgi:hypothetical protein
METIQEHRRTCQKCTKTKDCTEAIDILQGGAALIPVPDDPGRFPTTPGAEQARSAA